MKNKLKKFKDYLIKLIYPNHIKCIFCGDELSQRSYNDVCENCFETLPFIENFCERCGDVIPKDSFGVCSRCKINNFNFVYARSVFEYKNEVLNAVHGFKYSGKKYLFKPFARFMAEYYARQNLFVDFVTSVPMFELKEKERGYNQATLLAEEFSRLTNVPFVDCCAKVVDNVSQASLDFKDRQENVVDTFAFKPEFRKVVKGKTILLIDDIFTTGATSNEVCKVLLEGGAKACYVLTLAHTVLEVRP